MAARLIKSMFFKKDECARHYDITKTLGKGSFATVKLATSKADGKEFAVKIINKSALEPEDEEALETEVAILERVEHPNIVRMVQVFDCPKTMYMVMELMTGGELFDRIVAKEKYSEEEARLVVQKVTMALVYCHERGIVHRDLKPENLLYEGTEDSAEIKIADFGLAKLLKDTDMMATACGTPGYVAPEILEGKTYGDKVDMWSVGVIAYILLCGFPPFYDENNAELFRQIKSGAFDYPSPYWDGVSDQAKDLINHLLVVDPSARYSAEQVLSHPWVSKRQSTAALADAKEQLRKYQIRKRFRMAVLKARAIEVFAGLGGTSLTPAARMEETAAVLTSEVAAATLDGAGAGAGAGEAAAPAAGAGSGF